MSLSKTTKPFSVRRHVSRRILRFSATIGLVGSLLVCCAYIVPAYSAWQASQTTNLRALSEINCTGATCNTSAYSTDWQLEGPDYLIDTKTRYFLDVPNSQRESQARFSPLDFCDTTFVETLRKPTSYTTPDGEVWRLYSRTANWGGRNVEIIIGYAEEAPWRIAKISSSNAIDTELEREAGKIADNPADVLNGAKSTQKLAADGFAVADAKTGEIVTWGPWLPILLPIGRLTPKLGHQLYLDKEELCVVQTDVDASNRLVAISLVPIANLGWLGLLAALSFLIIGIIARALSRRFLRNYFAVTDVRTPALQEACRTGEGQSVEFKRGLSEDETKNGGAENELLKSVAAFANTNNGVIFVGVDDLGRIRGLDLNFTRKDRFERKIRQLTRNRINPSPPIQITFEELRGLMVAKIAVARGEAPAYLLDGVIYMRSGSSDVQAQPDDLRRLIAEFAV